MHKGIQQGVILGLLVTLSMLSRAQQQPAYPNLPAELKQMVDQDIVRQIGVNLERAARGVGKREEVVSGPISTRWQRLVLLTIADALAPDERVLQQQTFAAHRQMAQTARVDKQVGGSATSSGSTSLVEKGGIPAFLAWAIEHGGIMQSVNGNVFTLSGSPYGLAAALAGGDTDTNYAKYVLLRRVGVSVSFNLTENRAPSLAALKTEQISEFSFRFHVFGERDPRSERFRSLWNRVVGPHIQRKVELISGVETELYQDQLRTIGNHVRDKVLKEVAGISTKDSLNETDQVALKEAILANLRHGIYDAVKDGSIQLTGQQKSFLLAQLQELASVQRRITDSRTELQKQLSDFQKTPQLAFEYTNHPNQQGSDFSELKLMLDGKMGGITMLANAGISVYHDPNRILGQSRTRDFHVSGSLEGASRSPFLLNDNNLDPITYAVSGRFERLKEAKDNLGVVQGKVSIPIGPGISLPFSVTYATRTELIKEKEVRGNVGVSFDLEKLFALKQLDKLLKSTPGPASAP